MGTPITELYEMFLYQIEDELFALMGETLAKRQMYMYLLNSTTRFSTCKKDLTIEGNMFGEEYIPSSTKSIQITGLEKKPEVEVTLNDEELEKDVDYTITYSEENQTLDVNVSKEYEGKVLLEYSIDGVIKEELTPLEKRILVVGMTLEWLTPKINREENLKQRVTNKEFKKLSNATLLEKLIKLEDHRLSEYKNLIIDYSYRDFKGFA